MKLVPFIILVLICVGVYWFVKTDTNDRKARENAVLVKATIEKLRCEQRLKGDKSLVVVSYNGKSYSIFTEETRCFGYQVHQEIEVFYSKAYDKIFLSL